MSECIYNMYKHVGLLRTATSANFRHRLYNRRGWSALGLCTPCMESFGVQYLHIVTTLCVLTTLSYPCSICLGKVIPALWTTFQSQPPFRVITEYHILVGFCEPTCMKSLHNASHAELMEPGEWLWLRVDATICPCSTLLAPHAGDDISTLKVVIFFSAVPWNLAYEVVHLWSIEKKMKTEKIYWYVSAHNLRFFIIDKCYHEQHYHYLYQF